MPTSRPDWAFPVRLRPLQQGHDSLGLGQLGDLEMLLIVRRVLADEALSPARKGPGGLQVPFLALTVFPWGQQQRILCKAHCRLRRAGEENGGVVCSPPALAPRR